MNRFKAIIWMMGLFPILAFADTGDPLTLRAAKAPGGPNAWDEPAQISYVNNSNGDNSYAINVALSGNLPNIPGTTAQIQLTPWIAKDTTLAKPQDKHGLDAAVGFITGNADHSLGYFPQLTVSIDRDDIKHDDERQFEATVDFGNLDWNLGGCRKAIVHGCTYWDLMIGLYSDNVHSSSDNTGLGTINGTTAVFKVTSNPFSQENILAPISLSLLAQGQWDYSATGGRTKENRTLYKGGIKWRFYGENAKIQPSLELSRVVGSDLLVGLDKQGYTQLAFKLKF